MRAGYRTGASYAVLLSAIWLSPYSQATDYLEMDLEQLLQVNVTGATLREDSLKTVPSSVTLYTREQLDTLGLDYLHELLDLVPGFQTHRSGDSAINYTYSIRGRRQGGRAREIVLLVDGRVLSDPRSGGADSAIVLYPLANIERLEIIRGPASAIYGSGAFTGVINIVSRRAQNRVKLGAGENERGRADINLAQGAGDWSHNLYLHLAKDRGQEYTLSGLDTRDPRQELLLDWNLNYRTTQLQILWSDMQGDDFYTLEKVQNGFNHYRQESQHLRLEQYWEPLDNWHLRASIAYQKVRQHMYSLLQPAGTLAAISNPASNEPMFSKSFLSGDSLRIHLANDLELGEAASVQFGGEWMQERQIQATSAVNYDLLQLVNSDFPIRYYGNFNHVTPVGLKASRDLGGLYSQLLYDITRDTRLVGSLRYDYYESIGDHLSPRLGIIQQLGPHHTLKLIYGEAFRAPGFGETHLINNPVLVTNANLDNESVKTWELIWMVTWSQFSLETNLFHNTYENPITVGILDSKRTYVNGADQSHIGGGMKLAWQINPQWLAQAHYTHFKDMPDTFFREADTMGSLGLNYNRSQWNWSLSAAYHSERQYLLTTNQLATLDSYWYINTQLGYQLGSSTTITLAAKNALDKNYASPPQGAGLVGGVPNRGREISVGVNWDFN